MFFGDEDDERRVNPDHPELLYFINQEIVGIQLGSRNFTLFNTIPTHTEDGIPIRKLYVTNLPPKTTRTDLFGVFAQYGFIKSCWMRMGEKGPSKHPTPTYAFVTYSNPADAHKALEAPSHEKTLRGRQLRISPADSWHQPVQEADGSVRWKTRGPRRGTLPEDTEQGPSNTESTSELPDLVEEPSCSKPEIPDTPQAIEEDEDYSIMDILNPDCLVHILGFVPIADLIRSERVSKRWQSMVQEYIQGFRVFKTSWWHNGQLTTAVLRRLVARVGASLQRLHIDHLRSALNDRTAHTLGKFCPNLEELKVVGMNTKNWNPLIYGCKQLRKLSFISCNKITDSSLIRIVKSDSCVESLTVANNTHVTGLFLTGSNPPKLNSLAFYNCYSFQCSVLSAAIDSLPHLTTLKLDACPVTVWRVIHVILNKLPGLRELSLSDYLSFEVMPPKRDEFVASLGKLTELRVLSLSKNVYVTNTVLKQVAQTCTKLEELDVSSCNVRKNCAGVTDEGIVAVCSACRQLSRLDVSYLAELSDGGLRALPRLPSLERLVSRGNPALSAAPFAAALAHCHRLKELDLCGCDNVSEEVGVAAARALTEHPRLLRLHLAATGAFTEEMPSHKLLVINMDEDLSNPNLRPDFVDNAFEISSEDSFDDLYEHEDFDEFYGRENPYWDSDDDFLDNDDVNDDFELYAYGVHGQDIILL